NGHLTFDAPWSNYTPQQFPMNGTRDIIAPFWADLDNRDNGDIYYVQNTSGSLVQRVTQDINRYFPGLNFQANWIFIATWHEVAYYPKSGTQTTLQAVLTTNGHYSFVLMNYGSIASTSKSGGYDTISSSHHFTIPGSFSTNATGPNSTFRLGSNVNVPGRWAFRVDHGSIDCNFSGKNTNSRSDDGSSPAISLPRTFSYFGQSYSQIYAGYDTKNSSHHMNIPGSLSSNATGPNSTFSLNSNVNVSGRWAFRVDHGSRGCTFNGRRT
uniref:NIDO domain-containing protein n=1 Tax=Xiphophorus maculatus TaxID=8083 RepID=A0A3B5QH65_XIPMA